MNKCPQCNAHTMHVREVADKEGNVIAVYYDCQTCGYSYRLR